MMNTPSPASTAPETRSPFFRKDVAIQILGRNASTLRRSGAKRCNASIVDELLVAALRHELGDGAARRAELDGDHPGSLIIWQP